MWLDRDRFALPLEQFVCLAGKSTEAIQFVGISDACQHRIALGIYSMKNDGSRELVAWLSVPLHYKYKKVYKEQNYVEYIGVILQYLAMNILFPLYNRKDGYPIFLQSRADNMSAIAWMLSNKCKNLATQVACMAQNYMQIYSRIDIVSVEHLPGVEMKEIDVESRREEYLGPTEFCESLPPGLEIDLACYPIVRRFLTIADPTTYGGNCVQDLHAAYVTIANEFGSFIHRSDSLTVKFKNPPPVYQLVKFDFSGKKPRRLSSTNHMSI